MPRVLILIALLIAFAAPARAADLEVPQSYAECKADARYTKKTNLKCVFAVPIDKSNNAQTADYLACQRAKPNWQFLQKYNCEFADYDDKSKPRFARCINEAFPTYFPPFHDDCRHVYYNTDYEFPKTLKECMATDDHMEDVTPELKQICYVDVSFAPVTPGEVFRREEAQAFVEKCQIAGGEAEVVDRTYPECTLVFVEKDADKKD